MPGRLLLSVVVCVENNKSIDQSLIKKTKKPPFKIIFSHACVILVRMTDICRYAALRRSVKDNTAYLTNPYHVTCCIYVILLTDTD